MPPSFASMTIHWGPWVFSALAIAVALVGALGAVRLGAGFRLRSTAWKCMLGLGGGAFTCAAALLVSGGSAERWLEEARSALPAPQSMRDRRIGAALWASMVPGKRQLALLRLRQLAKAGFCRSGNPPRDLLRLLVDATDAVGASHDYSPLLAAGGTEYALGALRACDRHVSELALLQAHGRHEEATQVALELLSETASRYALAAALRSLLLGERTADAAALAERKVGACLALAIRARTGAKVGPEDLLEQSKYHHAGSRWLRWQCRVLAADLAPLGQRREILQLASSGIEPPANSAPQPVPHQELVWLLLAEEEPAAPEGIWRPASIAELGPESIVLRWATEHTGLHTSVLRRLDAMAELSPEARLLRGELSIRLALSVAERGHAKRAIAAADVALRDWRKLRSSPKELPDMPVAVGKWPPIRLSEDTERPAEFWAQSFTLAALVLMRAGDTARVEALLRDPALTVVPDVRERFHHALRFLQTGSEVAFDQLVAPIETTEEGLPFEKLHWLLVWQGRGRALLGIWGDRWSGYPSTALSWSASRIHSEKRELAEHVSRMLAFGATPHEAWQAIGGLGMADEYPALGRAVARRERAEARRDIAVLLWAIGGS